MSELWCPLAWLNVSVKTDGVITTCCHGKPIQSTATGNPITKETHTLDQAFYGPEFAAIRQNLSNGIKDANCEKCWQLEQQGIDSPRITEIKFGEYVDRKYSEPKLEILDISLGNQCNLKCRTCHSGDSSYWAREQWEFGDKSQDFSTYQSKVIKLEKPSDKFIESIKTQSLPNARELHFFGGEPFLMKSTWDLISYAIEKNLHKDLILSFNTNMTLWDSSKINLLDDFHEVDIAMSIDGIGKRFEYMRHPAQWNQVEENIFKAIEWHSKNPKGRNLILCCTVSSYNIFYVKEVLDFANSHDITFWVNPVFEPNNFAVDNIPTTIKEEIYKRLPKTIETQKLFTQMTSTESNIKKWQNFLEKIEKHDKYRSESFSDTFPEYWNIIKDYT
jgi:sulfatase maturation enzyme AslB (radical SAM superfamily)